MFFLRSFCARIRRVDKPIIPLLNEVEPTECAVHRHQNERVHSNVQAVIQAVKQCVPLTFAQNMNEFMNYPSMNAFRHNTARVTLFIQGFDLGGARGDISTLCTATGRQEGMKQH